MEKKSVSKTCDESIRVHTLDEMGERVGRNENKLRQRGTERTRAPIVVLDMIGKSKSSFEKIDAWDPQKKEKKEHIKLRQTKKKRRRKRRRKEQHAHLFVAVLQRPKPEQTLQLERSIIKSSIVTPGVCVCVCVCA
jgi:hypothetical protein